MERSLLYHCRALLMDEADTLLEGAYVVVEGETISSVGTQRPQGPFDREIDCGNNVLMPGLVNAHTHIPMTLLRGYGGGCDLHTWLNQWIFPTEAKLDGRAVRAGTGLALAELIAGGVTTIADMYMHTTDIAQTVQRTCRTLIGLIRHRQNITPVYRKLPLILGGEQSVSTDEPVRSINRYMDELEKDPRILSASWHVGYLRHDCPEAGCGVVVIPASGADRASAEQKADELAAFVWSKRHEFHYTGTTAQPDKALEMALRCPDKPVFITDSGDNVTSGAQGANTFILRQVLAAPDLHKKVLFAAIHDANLCHTLRSLPVDAVATASVGMGLDALSAPVPLTLRVLYKGTQEGTHMYGEDGSYGPLVTAAVEGTSLVLVFTDNNHSFVEEHQLDACGVDWKNFDIIVVKQGYIHPELKAAGALCVMSLTDGATPQDTRLIRFKRIMRPMFPIDEI